MTNTPPDDQIPKSVAKDQSTEPATQAQPEKNKIRAGFADKTLWELIEWLSVVLIPLCIGAGTIIVTWQQGTLSQNQHDNDQRIASQQQNAAILTAYLDDMTQLLLSDGLQASQPGAEVRDLASEKTLVALSQLDGGGKRTLIQFLYGKQLIGFLSGINEKTTSGSIVDLNQADLSKANLHGVDLQGADLHGVNLQGADLSCAYLKRVNLKGADLSRANLSEADLKQVDLSFTNLEEADLSYANLEKADLVQADLINANVTTKQLAQAKPLHATYCPDGSLSSSLC